MYLYICMYSSKKMIVRHPVAMFSIVFLIFESTLFFHHGRGRNVCFLQFSPKDQILKKQDIENRETILAFSIDIWLQFSCPQKFSGKYQYFVTKISIFSDQVLKAKINFCQHQIWNTYNITLQKGENIFKQR